MKLRERLATKRNRAEKIFVACVTAGDPDEKTTLEAAHVLAREGVDVLELGVPHSDPVADGPTNQASSLRALRRGMALDGVLALAGKLRELNLPIVIFTYLNPILAMGLDRFAARAESAGVAGVLVVDLPPEEATIGYLNCMAAHGLATVFLASPTTSPERLSLVEKVSSGFAYYISRTGVTGARPTLSPSLAHELARVRSSVSAPLCVGFGISTPAQVAEAAQMADGVVVGSRLVDCLAGKRPLTDLETCVRELIKPIKGVKTCLL